VREHHRRSAARNLVIDRCPGSFETAVGHHDIIDGR
jgi:hypothetical protein